DVIAEHRIVPDLERRDAGRIAIAAFERGDGASTVRRSFAKRIERSIEAFGDVAALRGIDRRRFYQSRAQAVDQSRMAAEARQQVVESSWRLRFLLKLASQGGGTRQAVPKQRQIARTSASGSQPRQRPREIG